MNLQTVKTFFHKAEAAMKKMFGSTTWEKTVTSTLTYVGPLLELLVGLAAGGPAENLVTGIVNTTETDLGTLAAVVHGATATPSTSELVAVTNALNSIKSNLPQLLTAVEVKNSTKSTEITATATTIIGEVDAMLANIPCAVADAPTITASTTA
jgi:hypothetical protein